MMRQRRVLRRHSRHERRPANDTKGNVGDGGATGKPGDRYLVRHISCDDAASAERPDYIRHDEEIGRRHREAAPRRERRDGIEKSRQSNNVINGD